MLYGISNTKKVIPKPFVTSIVRQGGRVGIPFCVQGDYPVTSFSLIPEGCATGYPIDLSYIKTDGDQYYYNGDTDLIDYLEGLGYSIKNGRYFLGVNVGGGYVTEPSLISTYSGNSIATIASSKAYGTWNIEVDYIMGKYFYFELLSTSGTPYAYSFYFDSSTVEFTEMGSFASMVATNMFFTESKKYNITITRDVTGLFSIYVGGALVVADITGTNPFTNNNITAVSNIQWQAGEGIGMREIDDIIPSSAWATTSGSFEIQQRDTDQITGGEKRYTDLFTIDKDIEIPTSPGAYSDGYSEGYDT
jgi:hypothetical protein